MISSRRFVNLKIDDTMATIAIENPAGMPAFSSAEDLQKKVELMFGTEKKLSTAEERVQPVNFKNIDALHGKTLYLV